MHLEGKMKSREAFEFWMKSDYFDEDTKKELEKISNDPAEIEERFYRDLEFGTGGLRGVIGAGTNRMNIYTVRKASQVYILCGRLLRDSQIILSRMSKTQLHAE